MRKQLTWLSLLSENNPKQKVEFWIWSQNFFITDYHHEKAFKLVHKLQTPSTTNSNGCITQKCNYKIATAGVDGCGMSAANCEKQRL